MSDRASLFISMKASDAWQQLEKWAAHECDESMKRIDSTAAEDLNIGKVCEERGMRKGIQKILQQVHYWAEGR